MKDNSKRVLIVGVYLTDAPNLAAAITAELLRSKRWTPEIRWAALGASPPLPELAELTRVHEPGPVPKFQLLNRLIGDIGDHAYQYLLVTDDDVELGDGFLDAYLALQERFELSLCQPARTHDSFIDHYFVAQLLGIAGRRTRFVEIGPVFSVAREAFPVLLPFDENAPMGWGLDFVWPRTVEKAGLHMGIIDATGAPRSANLSPTTTTTQRTTQCRNTCNNPKHCPDAGAPRAPQTCHPLRLRHNERRNVEIPATIRSIVPTGCFCRDGAICGTRPRTTLKPTGYGKLITEPNLPISKPPTSLVLLSLNTR